MLGFAVVFEGGSWFVALRELNSIKGDMGYVEAVRRSKDPSVFTVLFEDTAALIGLLIALAGVTAAHLLEMPVLDGAASIGISLVLGVTAVFLARETKGLLIGEPAVPEVEEAARRIAAEDPSVTTVNGLLTVHVGPSQIVAAISAEFDDTARADDIEQAVERIEARLREEQPDIVAVYVKPQREAVWERRRARLADG